MYLYRITPPRVLQGWRSPGFLVSRASSCSSSSSCNSSNVSPSSSAPSVDSGGSSPLPGECPPRPRDHQLHAHKTQPQTARWLVHVFVFGFWESSWYLWFEAGQQLNGGASLLTSIGEPLPVSAVQKQNRFSLIVDWCLFKDVRSHLFSFSFLYALMFKIHIIFLITSTAAASVWMFCISACLFKAPLSRKAQSLLWLAGYGRPEKAPPTSALALLVFLQLWPCQGRWPRFSVDWMFCFF